MKDGMRRIKLTMGRHTNDTTLTDMDTGEDLFEVFGFTKKISFDLESCQAAVLKLEIYVAELDIEGPMELEVT